jgi:hypothetical protein
MTGGEATFLVVSLAAFAVFAVVVAWANKRTRTR